MSGDDNNPATEKINDKNNITMENNQMSNPTWTGNWVWTDDKVKEAINYIIHHREKGSYGVSYHLKEFKLNDWFKQIGLKKDRIFKSNDEEVIMTSGELKQLIDLLR